MIPIKSGTAHRLGLRHPNGLLGGLSDSEYEELRDRWLKAHRESREEILASLPTAGAKPYLKPAIERATRPRRRFLPFRWSW